MADLLLRSYHEVRGAVFREEAGWAVPSGYGALNTEILAVRRDAGMIDFSDRAKVAVRGADRLTFLDGLVSADLKPLRPGASAYALVLSEQSRVLGDLRITASDDHFVLDLEAAQKDRLLSYFRAQVVSDDVAFEDLGSCGHIEVHGPRAPDAVSAVLGEDVRRLSVEEGVPFRVDRRTTGFVSRIATLGEKGYAIWAPGASVQLVWAALDGRGVPPFGREASDVLRIETGRPRFGVDMTEETLALEVAPEGAISYTKGCYKGQEVVARGTYVGHMNRRLLGLLIDGDVPPARGDLVRDADGDVGFVTSGCWSPTLGSVIALALLRVDRVRNDSILSVDHDGWDMRATLHPLPFVIGSA